MFRIANFCTSIQFSFPHKPSANHDKIISRQRPVSNVDFLSIVNIIPVKFPHHPCMASGAAGNCGLGVLVPPPDDSHGTQP